MNKEMLKEYAALKIEEARITARIEELKPVIVEDMAKNDLDKITSDFGMFTIGKMARWQYSEAVAALQEKEKATGIAKQVVSTILKFTKPKE